jgi:hypothetical protein
MHGWRRRQLLGRESSEKMGLAPQVGLEPTTLRLTAECLKAASRCKHKYLDGRKANIRGIWGDFGGTRRS